MPTLGIQPNNAFMANLDDPNIVDLHEFNFLVSCIANLEEQVTKNNENLTHVAHLLYALVCKQSQSNLRDSLVKEGAQESSSMIGIPHASNVISLSVHELLKSKKQSTYYNKEEHY